MCIKNDVLFSIIQVVRVCCGMLVGAAGIISNGGMFKCLMAAIQDTTMQTVGWSTICECKCKCSAGYNLLQFITKHDQSNIL